MALATTPRVALRAWQPSVESGRRSGVFPLTKNLPITIQVLRAREKDSPAVAPLTAARKGHGRGCEVSIREGTGKEVDDRGGKKKHT